MLEGYPGTRIGNVEDRCWGRVCAQEFAETGFGLFARVGVAWEDLNTRTGEVFGPDDGPEFADTRLDGALRHGFVDEEQNAAMPEGENDQEKASEPASAKSDDEPRDGGAKSDEEPTPRASADVFLAVIRSTEKGL